MGGSCARWVCEKGTLRESWDVVGKCERGVSGRGWVKGRDVRWEK